MIKSFFKKYFSFILSGFIIVGLVTLYFVHPPFQEEVDRAWDILLSEDQERVRRYVKQFGVWGPVAIIVFTVLQMFLIVFPSLIPIIVAVLAYGFWWGILISLAGVAVASTIGYFIGRKLKHFVINSLISESTYEKSEYWISNYAYGTVVLFRVSPLFSNDGISFIAGIFGMSYRKYMAATFTGMVPLSIAVGYFSSDIDRLEQGLYWIGGIGTLLYGVYIYFDNKKRKSKKKEK